MSLPAVTKTWDFNCINQRISWVSLLDASSSVMYLVKNELVSHCSWTVQWSCNGTTGPTSSADHTDRITSKAAMQVRATVAAAAQSWVVLNGGNGGQVLITYQGASDDIFRVSFSPGALFTLAGTTTNQPTATDEVLIAAAITMVGATLSTDRVMHCVGSTDGKLFRVFTYMTNACQRAWGLEAVVPTTTGPTFSPPVVVWNAPAITFANAASTVGGSIANNTTSGGQSGAQAARVNSTIIACGGGAERYLGGTSSVFTEASPSLNSGAPIVPLCYASNAANLSGKLGNRIDAWFPYSTGLAEGSIFGALQFVYFNTIMIPWDGASSPVTS